jgi:hypothetical protein
MGTLGDFIVLRPTRSKDAHVSGGPLASAKLLYSGAFYVKVGNLRVAEFLTQLGTPPGHPHLSIYIPPSTTFINPWAWHS